MGIFNGVSIQFIFFTQATSSKYNNAHNNNKINITLESYLKLIRKTLD